MRKEAVLSSLLTVFAAVVAMLLVNPPAASAAPTRIMALGDSITGSPGCWRALLWQRLQSAGQTGVDFVGTLPGQGCGFTYDGENEGHGGFLATNVADQNQLPGWLSATNPNIVLMHFGTNDVWNNRPVATILAAFGKLVDQMRANNPGMRILVAQIIPMNTSNCVPVRAAGGRPQRGHPRLGGQQDHRAVTGHRGRPVDRVSARRRHLRRRAPQRHAATRRCRTGGSSRS